MSMDLSLIIPSFIAGVLTFLAPCTLPLVPAYLGFISGVSSKDLHDPEKVPSIRKRIFLNGVLYALGFSVVFILFGTLFGLGGVALAQYRPVLQQIGGVLVIIFGLYLLKIVKIPGLSLLNSEKRFPLAKILKPGKPINSLLFGAAFAFGWTPCVGPILGSVLTLAAGSATVWKGAFLLGVFSLGLAIPFLAIAAMIGHASHMVELVSRYLDRISVIGGIFLLLLGILIVTNNIGEWTSLFYRAFHFINYDALLNYL